MTAEGMDTPNRLDAVLARCGLVDSSGLARLIGTGPDVLDLVHRLGTGDVKGLSPGEGRPTVLTNAKGRIVERLFVHHLGSDGVILVGGAGSAERVLAHLNRFTFSERTELSDRTASTAAFSLVGPDWRSAALAADLPEVFPYGAAAGVLAERRVHVLRSNGFDANGLMIVAARNDAGPVEEVLLDAAESIGGARLDAESFEAWRIISGLPVTGAELTEERNPLEAGLRDAISFTKGCYVGQEVIARLNTYDKVARELVRLELAPGAPTPPRGALVRYDGKDIGAITSAARVPGRDFAVAMAYVKSRDVPSGVGPVTIEAGGSEPSLARINR